MADVLNFPRTPWTRRLEQGLSGAPESLLTFGLLALAGMLVFVAVGASPAVKMAVFAWVVLP